MKSNKKRKVHHYKYIFLKSVVGFFIWIIDSTIHASTFVFLYLTKCNQVIVLYNFKSFARFLARVLVIAFGFSLLIIINHQNELVVLFGY